MKANRSARAADDEAVSSVVAAVLLFALFSTVVTLWTLTTLPEWKADREQAHAHAVQESFAALDAGLAALSAAKDAGPSTVPVVLGPDPVALVQSAPASGELEMQDEVAVLGTFTGEALHFSDGVAVGEPDEPVDEGAGDVLDDVRVLQALVVRLTTGGVGNGESAWLSVVADDGSAQVTALVTHAGKLAGTGPNEAGCLNSEVRIEVTLDVPPQPAYGSKQALLCEVAGDLSGYSLDLASPIYSFIHGVGRLATPYTITLTDAASGAGASADGYFAAAYVDSDGRARGAGSGEPVEYELVQRGPRLVYEPAYQSYQNQDVAWEFGATVVSQDDGQVVLQPRLDVAVDDGLGRLSWTLVQTGGDGSRAGSDQASVRVEHDHTTDLVLTADGATFTLTTPSAAAWRAYLAGQVLLSGSGSDVAVGGSGDTVTLTLASTTVTGWRIHLRLVEAHLTVL